MKKIALAAIVGYQRYLSPFKGFVCAHRVLKGGESCSAYGYRVIERYGVGIGLPLLRRRLAACGHVHRQHCAAKRANDDGVLVRAHPQAGFCDVGGCDVGDAGSAACDILSDCGSSRKSDRDENSSVRTVVLCCFLVLVVVVAYYAWFHK